MEPNAQQIYQFKESITSFEKYIIAVTIVLAIIIGCLIVYLVGYNIKENYRNIGNLIVLGFTPRDIFGILSIDTIILGVISLVTSSPLTSTMA